MRGDIGYVVQNGFMVSNATFTFPGAPVTSPETVPTSEPLAEPVATPTGSHVPVRKITSATSKTVSQIAGITGVMTLLLCATL